jgi:hypothetical protein
MLPREVPVDRVVRVNLENFLKDSRRIVGHGTKTSLLD